MALSASRLSRTYRHMGRYQHILTVLARHGFGEALQRLEIEHYLEVGLKLFGAERREPAPTFPARIRLALEELGPTFVKLGQLLSTRPDAVPLEIVRELERLQDAARPFSGAEAREIVEAELDRPVGELFRSFDDQPLATASLGQAHAAELLDGSRAVVKVQRPGIRRDIETDLEILGHLAGLAERRVEVLEIQQPSRLVAEFAALLDKELDYTIEAAHLRRFARLLGDRPEVLVPAVYRDLTTRRVLTLERLDGVKVSRIERLRELGCDLERIAQRGAVSLLEQVFVHGTFHADPHPGNLLVLPGDRIGFIDLGQVGRLDRTTRFRFATLLAALSQQDEEAVVDALLALTTGERAVDRTVLEAEVAELLDWHLDRTVGGMEVGRMLFRLVEMLTRQGRRIPPDLFLVMKALATVEGLARSLAPSFELADCARPVLRRLARERLDPTTWARHALDAGGDWLALVQQIPDSAADVLQLLRRGELRVVFQHRGIEPLLTTHERTANRLVFAVVLAALLIASSLVALGRFPPLWHGVPIFGIVGYLLSGVLGLALLWSIFRRGRL